MRRPICCYKNINLRNNQEPHKPLSMRLYLFSHYIKIQEEFSGLDYMGLDRNTSSNHIVGRDMAKWI